MLGDSDESQCNDALAFYGELKEGKHGTLITTNYVIDEASTLLMARKGINLATKTSISKYTYIHVHYSKKWAHRVVPSWLTRP